MAVILITLNLSLTLATAMTITCISDCWPARDYMASGCPVARLMILQNPRALDHHPGQRGDLVRVWV